MTDAPGTPIWFELNTPDADAARDFYAAVAGWTIAPSPMAEHGGYLIASTPAGAGVAGIMTPPPDAPAFPGWAIYFGVDDVDATAARAGDLGGATVFGPMDIPHVGRFAMMRDPRGVTFTIMRGDSPEPARAFVQAAEATGHAVWIELATPDPDAAFAFYGALFGFEKAGAMPMGEMGEYAFIGRGEDFRPGAVMSSATTGAPARWNWYVNVPDIDAAIATAQARGGTLLQGPDQIPGGDYSANLADPHGSQIGLVGPRQEK
jgi:predicted enzyme related to lactoylglutathione lyase